MLRHMRVTGLLAALLFYCGCPAPAPADAGVDPYDVTGPFAIGVTTLSVTTDAGRILPVEVWYPAASGISTSADFAVEEFESDPQRRAQLAMWISQAPEKCTPRRALGTRDAEQASGGARGLLVFSHCTECFRFSMHSVMERLASQGFIVAAPDHVTNTRFDATAPLTNAFLATRASDISGVIDALLSSTRFSIDPSRVAVVGHSFGAVTTGKVVELDSRVRGGFLLAAPVDSPFLNSGAAPRVMKPLSWLLAMEDNSISYLGNGFIRDNFTHVPRPNWLVEVENAGHWTFSDIAGLGGSYLPGCGDGQRDPDGGAFTYLDNDQGRRIAQRTVTAWAKWTLDGDEAAKAALSVELEGVTHAKAR
jgi:predicted dienelactone hydrolase